MPSLPAQDFQDTPELSSFSSQYRNSNALLRLSPELRDQIYGYVFPEKHPCYQFTAETPKNAGLNVSLLETSELISEEARRVLFSKAIFRFYLHGCKDLLGSDRFKRLPLNLLQNIFISVYITQCLKPSNVGHDCAKCQSEHFKSIIKVIGRCRDSRKSCRISLLGDCCDTEETRSLITHFLKMSRTLTGFRKVVIFFSPPKTWANPGPTEVSDVARVYNEEVLESIRELEVTLGPCTSRSEDSRRVLEFSPRQEDFRV